MLFILILNKLKIIIKKKKIENSVKEKKLKKKKIPI
jgi:hypothetical protein